MLRVGDRVIYQGEQTVHDEAIVVKDAHRVRAASDKRVYTTRYGLDGIADHEMKGAISKLYSGFSNVKDPIPEQHLNGKMALGEALLRVQREPCRRAKERLAFDEALGFFLSHGYQRQNVRGPRGTAHPIVNGLVSLLAADALYQQRHSKPLSRASVGTLPAKRPWRASSWDKKAAGCRCCTHTIVMVAETRSQVAVVLQQARAQRNNTRFGAPP